MLSRSDCDWKYLQMTKVIHLIHRLQQTALPEWASLSGHDIILWAGFITMDIKSSEAVLTSPSTKTRLCLKPQKMQDVLGSVLERCKEGKPRKAESRGPLMVVGSKSQRRHLPVSFQMWQRKLELQLRLSVPCTFSLAFWKAGTPPFINRLDRGCRNPSPVPSLAWYTPCNWNKAVGQRSSERSSYPAC